MRIRKLYACILLVFYCISFIPSIFTHEHSDAHNHNELSYCESNTENLDQYTTCSHTQHLNNLKEDCFLCEHCIVYSHVFAVQEIDSNDLFLIDKYYELYERLNLQIFSNYRNKSPPLLI